MSRVTKPPLTVRNVAIATASVEIKTLTVSGKQVTLAVFRQLRELPLLPDEGILAGQPWGIVNYHPDKCAALPEHWHVVWQDGEDLRRSAVEVTPKFDNFWSSDSDHFVTSCLHDLITTGTTPYFDGNPPLERLLSYDGITVDTGHGFRADLALTDAGRSALAAWMEVRRHRSQVQKSTGEVPLFMSSNLQKAEQRFAAALTPLTAQVTAFEASTDVLYERYTAALTAEQQRRERHVQIRGELAALPQLFIAV